ncbi:MAG: site-2 protease family protein [Planctomycetaceae bacterium]|nr:MAG: site-2 protease family protein [Planctomycetaceae bacterium]
MGLLSLLIDQPFLFVLLSVPLLYSIVLHELAHGWMAARMGDPTAQQLGRLSLNPLKHLDPVGTLLLFVFGFGWAKPVPVDVRNFREPRKGFVLVSAAGIVVNVILAFLALLALRLSSASPADALTAFLYILAQVNLTLAAFNLIPIPPLDGSKILMGLVSGRILQWLLQLERYGFIILIGLLYFDVLDPVIRVFRLGIWSFINLLLP